LGVIYAVLLALVVISVWEEYQVRRLADALETGERFEIQVAGERVYVPARAEFNVEHEREEDEEEIEFQLKWTKR
jgi:amphi-Trp domain-containing protein